MSKKNGVNTKLNAPSDADLRSKSTDECSDIHGHKESDSPSKSITQPSKEDLMEDSYKVIKTLSNTANNSVKSNVASKLSTIDSDTLEVVKGGVVHPADINSTTDKSTGCAQGDARQATTPEGSATSITSASKDAGTNVPSVGEIERSDIQMPRSYHDPITQRRSAGERIAPKDLSLSKALTGESASVPVVVKEQPSTEGVISELPKTRSYTEGVAKTVSGSTGSTTETKGDNMSNTKITAVKAEILLDRPGTDVLKDIKANKDADLYIVPTEVCIAGWHLSEVANSPITTGCLITRVGLSATPSTDIRYNMFCSIAGTKVHYSADCIKVQKDIYKNILEAADIEEYYGCASQFFLHEGRETVLLFMGSVHMLGLHLSPKDTANLDIEEDINKKFKYIRSSFGQAIFASFEDIKTHYSIPETQRRSRLNFAQIDGSGFDVKVMKNEFIWDTCFADGRVNVNPGKTGWDMRESTSIIGDYNGGTIGLRLMTKGMVIKCAAWLTNLDGMEKDVIMTNDDNVKLSTVVDMATVIVHSASKLKSGNLSNQVLMCTETLLTLLEATMDVGKLNEIRDIITSVLISSLMDKILGTIAKLDDCLDFEAGDKEFDSATKKMLKRLYKDVLLNGGTVEDFKELDLFIKTRQEMLDSLMNKFRGVNVGHQDSYSGSIEPDQSGLVPRGELWISTQGKIEPGKYLLYRSPASEAGSMMLWTVAAMPSWYKRLVPCPNGRMVLGMGIKEAIDDIAVIAKASGCSEDRHDVWFSCFHQTYLNNNLKLSQVIKDYINSEKWAKAIKWASTIQARGNGWDYDNDPAIIFNISKYCSKEELTKLETVMGLDADLPIGDYESYMIAHKYPVTAEGITKYSSDIDAGIFGVPKVGPYALISSAATAFNDKNADIKEYLRLRIEDYNKLITLGGLDDGYTIDPDNSEILTLAANVMLQGSVDKKTCPPELTKYYAFLSSITYGMYDIQYTETTKEGPVVHKVKSNFSDFETRCVMNHAGINRGTGPMTKNYKRIGGSGADKYKDEAKCFYLDTNKNKVLVPNVWRVGRFPISKVKFTAIPSPSGEIVFDIGAYSKKLNIASRIFKVATFTKLPANTILNVPMYEDRETGEMVYDTVCAKDILSINDLYFLPNKKAVGYGKHISSRFVNAAKEKISKLILPLYKEYSCSGSGKLHDILNNDNNKILWSIPRTLDNGHIVLAYKSIKEAKNIRLLLTILHGAKFDGVSRIKDNGNTNRIDMLKEAWDNNPEWRNLESLVSMLRRLENSGLSVDETYEQKAMWKNTWFEAFENEIKRLDTDGFNGKYLVGRACMDFIACCRTKEVRAIYGSHVLTAVEGPMYNTISYCTAILTPYVVNYLDMISEVDKAPKTIMMQMSRKIYDTITLPTTPVLVAPMLTKDKQRISNVSLLVEGGLVLYKHDSSNISIKQTFGTASIVNKRSSKYTLEASKVDIANNEKNVRIRMTLHSEVEMSEQQRKYTMSIMNISQEAIDRVVAEMAHESEVGLDMFTQEELDDQDRQIKELWGAGADTSVASISEEESILNAQKEYLESLDKNTD